MKQRQHSARLFCRRSARRRSVAASARTSDPIPPEEMVEGVGYFQFVYADGETRTFRYASEEQGLWIGEDERCLVDGQAFYDWQERLMEALQK